MEFKSNFNKLHYLLTEKFENVSTKEKANPQIGSYIELIINEGVECKVIIQKRELDKDQFNWSYFINPLNESYGSINRVSSIDSFTDTITDIINNKRFDSDYLKSLK